MIYNPSINLTDLWQDREPISPISSVKELIETIRVKTGIWLNGMKLIWLGNDTPLEAINNLIHSWRAHEVLRVILKKASSLLKSWEKVMVETQQWAIEHHEFREMISETTENWKYAKWLTLDLMNTSHESDTKKNIRETAELGVWFSIEPFIIESDGSVRVLRILKLFSSINVLPQFLKIHDSIFKAISSNPLLNWLKAIIDSYSKKGTKIFRYTQWNPQVSSWDNMQDMNQEEVQELIKHAWTRYEPMINEKWDIEAREILVDFPEHTTWYWLRQLKRHWHTTELMKKILSVASQECRKGQCHISVNAYLADLSIPGIAEIIDDICVWLTLEQKKRIIIEILEDPHGTVNELSIANIKEIQQRWYSIALDDLNLKGEDKNMSKKTLEDLIIAWVYVDMLKIDGIHMMDIFNNKIISQEIDNIRQLIQQLTCLRWDKGLRVVAEWVQDEEHMRKIKQTLFINPLDWWDKTTYLYQWKRLAC